jgi:hypothetical protein
MIKSTKFIRRWMIYKIKTHSSKIINRKVKELI